MCKLVEHLFGERTEERFWHVCIGDQMNKLINQKPKKITLVKFSPGAICVPWTFGQQKCSIVRIFIQYSSPSDLVCS